MDYYSTQVRREEANALRSRLTAFVELHEQKLFETQHCFSHPTDATYWCWQKDVVAVHLGDTTTHVTIGSRDNHHQLLQRRQLQQTSMADLVGEAMMTADPLLFRLSVTLAALNAEMLALADEGRRCFAPALALVGDENENCYRQRAAAEKARRREGEGGAASLPASSPSHGSGGEGGGSNNSIKGSAAQAYHPTSPEEEGALKDEQLLHQTGNLLSLFQDIWLWRQRVQEVCATVVCQFACIYGNQAGSRSGSSNKTRDATSPLRAVRLTSCWDHLAELLGVVVVVDELLHQNGSLHDGVAVMQRVLAQQTMESSQDGADGNDDEEAELLRLLLHRLEEDLLQRSILAAVVRQPFDRLLRAAAARGEKESSNTAAAAAAAATRRPTPTSVLSSTLPPPFREQKGFCAEWAAVLTSRCNDFEAALTSAKSAGEKSAFAGICGLAFFFQGLFTTPLPSGGGVPATPTPVVATAVTKMVLAKLQGVSKQVAAWQSSLPLVPLHGLYALCPLLWWQRHFPALVDKTGVGARIQESVVAACQSAGAQFSSKVAQWSTQVERWAAVEMQTASPLDAPLCRQFIQRLVLLIQQGMQLAKTVHSGLMDLLFLHHHAERPLATSLVPGVLTSVLLLQRIAEAYHSKMGILASSQEALVQSIAYALEKHLYNLYTRACAESSANATAAVVASDQLIALHSALHLLRKPLTTDAVVCLALMLDIALNREQLNASAPSTTATEEERDEAFIALVQLRNIVSYQQKLPTITQASFLYFFREVLYPLFFQHCYANTLAAAALPCIVAALTESRALVMAARHVENPASSLLADAAAFLRDCLDHEVVQPLCAEIENQLRLRTHNVVLGQPYRVLRPSVDPAGRDLTRFTLLPPFRLFHQWVHLATQVEHYLSTQFYNLNALAPNDWRTYEEMRNLAHRTYHLRVADGHLPGCILDQGLDVLVVTENIHQFIAYYTYNLNAQVFVQRPALTLSKHLHSLNTRHIANSIRTHGTGVMNTAVNYVYKCLLKKMAVLSHFLQDDYVRSHLLKDARVVRQRKKEHQAIKYPTEQADQFIREMDRLGVAEDGCTFLEKARQLIGEMGNALGFMRMMRSGGLRAVAEGARFVPLPPPRVSAADKDARATAASVVHLSAYLASPTTLRQFPPSQSASDADEAAEDSEGGGRDGSGLGGGESGRGSAPQLLRRSTAAAVDNLDQITHSMLQRLSNGSEFFPLLLDAIGRRLRRSSPERYAHLHLLYLLVPALANLHVAYAIREKEKLLKKHKDEGVFSDDGFAVGASFLLVLFGVYDEFDSLHWFSNKKTQYRQALESVHAALSSASASGSTDFDNLHLTSSTLQMHLNEYAGLENAFTSSRLFFATTMTSADSGAKKPSSRRARSPTGSSEEEVRSESEGDDEKQS
jgi:WASH complex subunit 7